MRKKNISVFMKSSGCVLLILCALWGLHSFESVNKPQLFSTYSLSKHSTRSVKTTKAKTAIAKKHVFKVYLSPSCQTWNPYCDGSGSEEYHMRQIAEKIPAYLSKYGIQSVLAAPQTGSRNNQKTTIAKRAQQASAEKCDLYLAIHSNARDGSSKSNGPTIFYPSKSMASMRLTQLLAANFIYPDKNAVDYGTNDALWEMHMPSMPHCLIELAYHDNPTDVRWIENNKDKIAKNLADCIALYANVPAAKTALKI